MKPPASRTAPCPCGSGRRYKECHGALGAPGPAAAAPPDPRELVARGLAALGRGDLAAAERTARAVHDVDPIHPDAWHLLALAALARGEHAAALEACDRAIAVLRDHAAFHVSRARALLGLGRDAEAGEALRAALAVDPANAEARFYLGNLARSRGEPAAAARIYEEALREHPGDALLLNNLGLALEDSGDLDAATMRYEQALAAQVPPVEAHANLARVLQSRGDFPGAARHYQVYVTTSAAVPARVWSSLGFCQYKLGALPAAEESYRKALALVPGDAATEYALAALLVEVGKSAEAIAHLAALRERAPSAQAAHALLSARALVCDWTDWPARVEEIRALLAQPARGSADTLVPLNALALPLAPAEQLAIAKRFAATFRAAARGRSVDPPPAPARGARLKIGYVSSDFRAHPIAYLLTELWERHDRSRFEVYAYSIGPGEDSALRRRIERAFEHFVNASDDAVERTRQRIRADGIEILIDLNGYTSGGRPEIFVPRTAPLQMHWLGFLGTLGADGYDYIVTDPFVTPPAMQSHFTERFLYLPGGYTPSDTRRAIDPRPQRRAEQDLPEGAIVFCCFNSAYKIVPPMFDAWMRILAAVPGSVLWLSPASEATYANLRREAENRGVPAQRLVFMPRADPATYLARLRLADLFLDTWPYNAGTTTNDALFVGLPVLTCAGETMASRVAGSQLHTVGVPELVTRDLAEYEATAIALARAPERLAALRERIRDGRSRSALFDMARYTRELEDALAAAWADYEGRSATATS